ncbi:MAG: FliM/FliN family flagellar motor switch protein, partial [Deltaproteobacteria bacterium]|nr:FliM/FliN family flagellar motor switch protein [Deltaproteobacteria bacterium]
PGARRGELERAPTVVASAAGVAIEFAVSGSVRLAAVLHVPPGLELRVPPPRTAEPAWPWPLDLPVVVASCALPREAARLAVGDVVIVERALRIWLGEGAVGLAADPGAIEARVATGYVPRAMIADDAHLELTVQLGTTRLPVRRLAELAVGEVIPLGRPLAGPYELRVGGRTIGRGELLDVDGEVGVRIVSLDPAE